MGEEEEKGGGGGGRAASRSVRSSGAGCAVGRMTICGFHLHPALLLTKALQRDPTVRKGWHLRDDHKDLKQTHEKLTATALINQD